MAGFVDNPPKRENGLSQTNEKGPRSVRGGCTPCPTKALVRPPCAPWEEAPTGSLTPGQHDSENSYCKVQGMAGKGRHGVDGISKGLARKHNGGLSLG